MVWILFACGYLLGLLFSWALCRASAAGDRAHGHCVRGAGIDMAESRRRHEGADEEEYRGA